jgi:hypothetical protein
MPYVETVGCTLIKYFNLRQNSTLNKNIFLQKVTTWCHSGQAFSTRSVANFCPKLKTKSLSQTNHKISTAKFKRALKATESTRSTNK